MDAREPDLLPLIDIVYNAVENDAAWTEFLSAYVKQLHAVCTYVQVHHLERQSSQMLATSGLSLPFRASYNDYYSGINVWRDREGRRYVPGAVVVDQELCPRERLLRTEFYNDYIQPIGGAYCNAGIIARDGQDALVLGALRGAADGMWTDAERRAIARLLPHVARVHQITSRLRLHQANESLLDTLDIGVVFVTTTGVVVGCNRVADAILRAADGLFLRGGSLHASAPSVMNRLRTAIERATQSGRDLAAPLAVAIERPSLKPAYRLLAAPVRHGGPLFAGMRAPDVMLLILDGRPASQAPTDVLLSLYGLTRREAALAARLASGESLREAATGLGMAYETARSHLRRIFSKTNTSRQSELITLLTRIPTARPAHK
ncbi:MAG TPA: helix-turn-helix transcriptional regulator [Vicinamibacterales bacterium]|nr:helix-turn-helix transcriptional regulator [Vicinamibacterales bacterium]